MAHEWRGVKADFPHDQWSSTSALGQARRGSETGSRRSPKASLTGCGLVCVIPVVDNRRPQSHDLRLMHRRREEQSLEMHRRIAARLVLDPDAVLAKACEHLNPIP